MSSSIGRSADENLEPDYRNILNTDKSSLIPKGDNIENKYAKINSKSINS